MPNDFSALKLRQFVSPGFGLVFEAPQAWQDNSDKSLFQVVDPATGAQFTASGYENPGVSLKQWTDSRLSVVSKEMLFLKAVKTPYEVKGPSWVGIATEYQGRFPESDDESRYLVLCLRTEKIVVSFSITAKTGVFAANEGLYRWLLENHLQVYQVNKIQDDERGVAQLRKSAQQGNADAQFNLGGLHERGGAVPQDYREAATWYRKAAEQGHVRAQLNLGVFYANGQGVAQDYGQAAVWWRKAAEKGDANAQFYLAKIYADGLGVPRDYRQAVEWCRKSASQGHKDAQTQLAILESKLS